jgi:c-di-GMP-binding flagellar brake protein YcgR
MPIGLVISPKQKEQILAGLCARNQSAQLVYSASDKPAVRASVRFLEWVEGMICVDHPMAGTRPLSLGPGEPVTLYFRWEKQHLSFSTLVTGRGKWRKGSLETLALYLQAPSKIVKGQRRECYRLSLIHVPDAVIQFEDPAGTGALWAGMLVDLSETGGGVMAEKDKAPGISPHDTFVSSFMLPGFEFPCMIPCEVRWRKELPDGDRFKIGVQWELDADLPEHRQLQKDLARFIANEQVEALRRKRDKEM